MPIGRLSKNQKLKTKHSFFKGFIIAAVVSLVALSAAPASFAITQRIAPYACPDLTRDGNVDASDLSALAAAQPPAVYNWSADLNGDGLISSQDAQVWDGYRGQTGMNCSDIANRPVWTGPCPDLTGDGYADGSDVSALAAALSPAKYSPLADLNGDGVVNAQDSSVLGGYLGQSGFICNRPHVPVSLGSTDIVEVTLPPTPVETAQSQPTTPLTAPLTSPIESTQTQSAPASSPAAMPPVVPTGAGPIPTQHITQSPQPTNTFTTRMSPKKTSLLKKKKAMKLRKAKKQSLKLKLVARKSFRAPRLH